jgi:hypothetical protein
MASILGGVPNLEGDMKSSIAVLVLMVFTVGTVFTQPLPSFPQVPPGPSLEPLSLPKVPQAAPQPVELTIEQLLDEIEKVRAQKSELEKKEQALMVEARKKLGKQTERLNRLGLGSAPQPPVQLDFVPPTGIAPPGAGTPPSPNR